MYIECRNKCYIAILSYDTIVLGKSTCVERFSTQVEKHSVPVGLGWSGVRVLCAMYVWRHAVASLSEWWPH